MNLFKPISISLSPNTEKDDIRLALKLIFRPRLWKKKLAEDGPLLAKLEGEFKEYLGVNYAFSFNSGRSALMAILSSFGLEEDDEVLLQAFTCNAAVNPILDRGAKPVFVDIDDTLNLDPDDLRKKITPKSKAIMIQHTFGWPAQVEEISKIAKENNLYLIEDCAHSLGAKYKGKFCGTFGEAAFFSFGRDKIISSVFGGMAVTDNDKIAGKIKEFQKKTDYPSNFWIFQQLLHPVLTNYLVLPAYGLNANLGKIFLGILHKLSILSKAVYKKEKKGEIPEYFPKRLPEAISCLALNQFKKLERFNSHRREIASFYQKELTSKQSRLRRDATGQENTDFILPLMRPQKDVIPSFMRYPILTNFSTDKILKLARKRKIYLDDGWRKSPIVPPDTNIKKMKYVRGSCKKGEEAARTILNLPTHINISQNEAKKIVDFLKQYGA